MIKAIGILKSKSYIPSRKCITKLRLETLTERYSKTSFIKPRSSLEKYYIFDKNGTYRMNSK